MLKGKRKLEQPTKVVFKKNTANKKGLTAGQESNTRLTKFFGVKKQAQSTDDFELADHDDLEDKSSVEKD